MKIVKTASGKTKLVITKQEFQRITQEAGLWDSIQRSFQGTPVQQGLQRGVQKGIQSVQQGIQNVKDFAGGVAEKVTGGATGVKNFIKEVQENYKMDKNLEKFKASLPKIQQAINLKGQQISQVELEQDKKMKEFNAYLDSSQKEIKQIKSSLSEDKRALVLLQQQIKHLEGQGAGTNKKPTRTTTTTTIDHDLPRRMRQTVNQ